MHDDRVSVEAGSVRTSAVVQSSRLITASEDAADLRPPIFW